MANEKRHARIWCGCLVVAVLLGCKDVTVTGPTPTPPEPHEEPTEIRNDTEPNLLTIRGTSAFALGIYDEDHIRAFIENVRVQNYNAIRMLGEHHDPPWGQYDYLPRGPDLPGALENVRKVLRITAEYPGFYVLLVPVATIRDHRSFGEMLAWTQQVADLIIEKDYRHVIIEAVNEHFHPDSLVQDEARVCRLVSVLQTTGRPVGSDDSVAPGSLVYNPALATCTDFVSVHTWRERPLPTATNIRKMVRKNGGLVIISEPHVTERYAWHETVAVKEACTSTPGCVWFAHSLEGIHCRNTEMILP